MGGPLQQTGSRRGRLFRGRASSTQGAEPGQRRDPEGFPVRRSPVARNRPVPARIRPGEQGHAREAMEQAERDSGLKAAEEAVNAAEDVRLAIRDRIVSTRARTLAGLIFKARYASTHFPGDEDEDVMKSIVADLLAMAPKEREAT